MFPGREFVWKASSVSSLKKKYQSIHGVLLMVEFARTNPECLLITWSLKVCASIPDSPHPHELEYPLRIWSFLSWVSFLIVTSRCLMLFVLFLRLRRSCCGGVGFFGPIYVPTSWFPYNTVYEFLLLNYIYIFFRLKN